MSVADKFTVALQTKLLSTTEHGARQAAPAEEEELSYGKWQFYFKLSGSGNFASLNRTAKSATFGRTRGVLHSRKDQEGTWQIYLNGRRRIARDYGKGVYSTAVRASTR